MNEKGQIYKKNTMPIPQFFKYLLVLPSAVTYELNKVSPGRPYIAAFQIQPPDVPIALG